MSINIFSESDLPLNVVKAQHFRRFELLTCTILENYGRHYLVAIDGDPELPGVLSDARNLLPGSVAKGLYRGIKRNRLLLSPGGDGLPPPVSRRRVSDRKQYKNIGAEITLTAHDYPMSLDESSNRIRQCWLGLGVKLWERTVIKPESIDIRFSVDTLGSLIKLELHHAIGKGPLDCSALECIRAAAPFPELANSELGQQFHFKVGITFHWNPT